MICPPSLAVIENAGAGTLSRRVAARVATVGIVVKARMTSAATGANNIIPAFAADLCDQR